MKIPDFDRGSGFFLLILCRKNFCRDKLFITYLNLSIMYEKDLL